MAMGDPPLRDVLTCTTVRPLLADLVGRRLDEAVAERVRAHVLDCDACDDALAEAVAADVVRHPEPRSPYIPPLDLYDAFQRARTTRFGVLWKSVRDALASTDADVRAWGASRRDGIRTALDALLSQPALAHVPHVRSTVHAIRTRGEIRTRGSVRATPGPTLAAEVVNSDSVAVGGHVTFVLAEPPRIDESGRFHTWLRTTTPGYEGQVVLCAVDVAEGQRVSFAGILESRPRASAFDVSMDEAAVGDVAGEIPLDRVTLFITRPRGARDP